MNVRDSTSRSEQDHFLGRKLTPRQMDSVLVEWANTPTSRPDQPYTPAAKAAIEKSDAGIKRLVTRYPEFFRSIQSKPPSPEHWEFVWKIQIFLREAWDAPDPRTKDWCIYKARDRYSEQAILKPQQMDNDAWGIVVSPPPLTPFERLMFHFHGVVRVAKHCPAPECPAPYFLARKKNQKYCSEACAAPSHREQNLKWWHESPNSPKNRGKTKTLPRLSASGRGTVTPARRTK